MKIILALLLGSFLFQATYLWLLKKMPHGVLWEIERSQLIAQKIDAVKNLNHTNFIFSSCAGESNLLARKLSHKDATWFNFSLRGVNPEFFDKLSYNLYSNARIKHEIIFVLTPTDLLDERLKETNVYYAKILEDALQRNIHEIKDFDVLLNQYLYSGVPISIVQKILWQKMFPNENDVNKFYFKQLVVENKFKDRLPFDELKNGDIDFNYHENKNEILKLQENYFQKDFEAYIKFSNKYEGREELKINPTLWNRYLKLFTSLKNKTSKLNIVIVPEFSYYAKKREHVLAIQKIVDDLKKQEISVIDLNNFFVDKNNCFLDFERLSPECAEMFTKKVGESI